MKTINLDRESARKALKDAYRGKSANWHSPVITVDTAGQFELQPAAHRLPDEIVVKANINSWDDIGLEADAAAANADAFVDDLLADAAETLNNLGHDARKS